MSVITAKPLTAVPLTARPLTAMALGVSDAAAWTPLSLFAAGEQGVYYDPSDFATLFQDSAGTTPVTTFGQPVGKMLDKSGNGNHATQATAGKRPVLARVPFGGRRNILLATDTMSTQSSTVTAAQHTLSFTGTGTVTLSGVSTAGPLVGTGVSDRVSLTFTPTAGSLTLTVSGSVTLAQLELGSTATPYQKVTSTYDVTEAGKADCWGLLFDGVDDALVSSTVDLTATDKLDGFFGYYKATSVTSEKVIVEVGIAGVDPNGHQYSIDTNLSPGSTNRHGTRAGGATHVRGGYPAGIAIGTYVWTATTDRAVAYPEDLQNRINGAILGNTTNIGSAVTGNYANKPFYMAHRNPGGLYLSGIVFTTIIRGAKCSASDIASAEAWVANKTGVTL